MGLSVHCRTILKGVNRENQDIQKRICNPRKTLSIGYVFGAMLYRL